MLAGLTVEQLSVEDLGKYGLPREAQMALRSKLEQISREKPAQTPNGIDLSILNLGHHMPSVPSSMQWLPAATYASFHTAISPLPRSGPNLVDSLPGTVSNLASGYSPPVSPGPVNMKAGLLGKAPAGDSSEGSEDTDKTDGLSEIGKYISKSVQVKVSHNSEGGGASSPLPLLSNARMTPPGETSSKATAVPLQPAMQHMINMYPSYNMGPSATATHSQGLLVQPHDSGLMGAMPGNVNNTNNNSYAVDSTPIMSTGMPQRPSLLHGAQTLRGTGYKPSQPQPAHTNMSILQQKPGSPVIPMSYVNMRPADLQPPLAAGIGNSNMPPMDGNTSQRIYMSYGRGHGGSIAVGHMPPVHAQTQPGVIPFSLVTRSVQTSLPGSASVMTVSASHPATTVTASHPTSSSSMNRSPSHTCSSNGSGGGVQRDSSVEVMTNAMSDASLRSSPLQVAGQGMPHVSATPSPPASVHGGCHVCAQGAQYSHTGQYGPPIIYPYYYLSQGPNGMIHHPVPLGYYSTHSSQPLGSLTNGYGGPDLYSYSQPAFPTALNPSHIYPMMQGSAMYPPSPAPVAAAGNSAPSALPQSAPGGVAGAGPVPQAGGVLTIKQRNNSGCYNCGSTHRAGECPESSMETMSGKAVYSLDFKPSEESD